MSRLVIEKYSTKPLFGRRQYAARILDERSGDVLWRTSESYNNREDRDHAVDRITRLEYSSSNGPMTVVIDLDRQRTPGL